MSGEFTGLILVVPERGDVERDAVADAWRAGGGEVLRLGRFWDPPPLEAARVRPYGNDAFCLVLAQKLGLEPISPPDHLLGHLDASLLGRAIELVQLADVERLAYPRFVKSAVPKLFAARVHADVDALREETRGLAAETLLIASEIVEFEAEVRCFVLAGEVLTLAAYEGEVPALDEARELAARIATNPLVPRTCVLDVGRMRGRGWGLIEANASWGAGLNGCEGAAAARCIAAAWQ
jgi:hypothetical protein